MGRSLRLRTSGTGALCILVLLCASGRAAGWSSTKTLDFVATHQYIDGEAYARLRADPAFQQGERSSTALRFPTLDEILAFEGMTVHREGEGMDVQAPYSWHYYNPITTQGQAPGRAADFFEIVRRAGLEWGEPVSASTSWQGGGGGAGAGAGSEPAKATAWLAHIIADLSSPYHVAGQPADELPSARIDASMEFPLDYAVVGPGGAFITNWGHSIDFFLSRNPRPDWFDPWYWNGRRDLPDALRELNGTHAWLEFSATMFSSANVRSGYSPLLVQQLPAAGRVAGSTVADFARQRALETWRTSASLKRSATKEWYDGRLIDPSETAPTFPVVSGPYGELLDQAIQDVYSVWRATISALRPTIEVAFDPETSSHNVVVTVYNAEATEPAQDVAVAVEVLEGGKLVTRENPLVSKGPPSVLHLDRPIDPQGSLAVRNVWVVENPDASLRVRARVTAHFSRTPDAGEVVVEREFKLTTQMVLVTVVDAETGAPRPGATVSITARSGDLVMTSDTDASGEALFRDVTVGTYRIGATAANYDPREITVTLDGGPTTTRPWLSPAVTATIPLTAVTTDTGTVAGAVKSALAALGYRWVTRDLAEGTFPAEVGNYLQCDTAATTEGCVFVRVYAPKETSRGTDRIGRSLGREYQDFLIVRIGSATFAVIAEGTWIEPILLREPEKRGLYVREAEDRSANPRDWSSSRTVRWFSFDDTVLAALESAAAAIGAGNEPEAERRLREVPPASRILFIEARRGVGCLSYSDPCPEYRALEWPDKELDAIVAELVRARLPGTSDVTRRE